MLCSDESKQSAYMQSCPPVEKNIPGPCYSQCEAKKVNGLFTYVMIIQRKLCLIYRISIIPVHIFQVLVCEPVCFLTVYVLFKAYMSSQQ